MVPGHGDDRLHLNPGRLHVQQQERNSGLRLAVELGPHKAEHAVGEVGVGRPDLRSV